MPEKPIRCPHFLKTVLLILLTVAAALTDVSSIYGQDSLRIRQFGLAEGLAQITINDLVMDEAGFVWAATEAGLNRFDGSEFEQFMHDPADSTSIPGNMINTLARDSSGNIWIGTIGNGLCYYETELDVFRRVHLKGVKDNKETISDIVVDSTGAVWVSTRTSGLYLLTPDKQRKHGQHIYLDDKRLGGLSIDNDDKMWVGTHRGEVYVFDPRFDKTFAADPECVVEGHVQAIYHVGEDVLLGSDSGLYTYSKSKRSVQKINLSEDHETRFVVAFLRENENLVWMATGNGLYLYDTKSKEVIRSILHHKDNGTEGLSSNTVYSLLRTSDRQILAGTFYNLNLIDFHRPHFGHLSSSKRSSLVLSDDFITEVFYSPVGLWIGTSDRGLNLISDGHVYQYQAHDDLQKVVGCAFMETTYDPHNHALWMATSRGLVKVPLDDFDPADPSFQVFQHDPGDPSGLSMDHLTAIATDSNGMLWAGSYGAGVMHIEPQETGIEVVHRYVHDRNDNSLVNNFISDIVVDHIGDVWIGTEGGISRLAATDKGLVSPELADHSSAFDKPVPALGNHIVSMTVDESELWIAAKSELFWIVEGQLARSWKLPDQYVNTTLSSIAIDDNRIVWIGTNKGIVSLDPNTEIFHQYGAADGIKSESFQLCAVDKDVDGTLYFGGSGGVTYFQPDDLIGIDKAVPVYFSEMRSRIRTGDHNGNSNDQWERNKDEGIKINHNQFPLYIRLSSIDFRFNRNYQFGYKLYPLDQGWNILNGSEIQFPNLQPGRYTLQVNGFSRGVQWDRPPEELTMTIVPPWWRSQLAYVLYMALFLATCWWFYRFQLSRHLAIAETTRLKEMDQHKSQLYTNITHEFRTPLTVILGITDNLRIKLREYGHNQLEDSTSMITRNGQRLLKLVNSMLDLAKLESGELKPKYIQGDIVPYIKYLAESFQSYFDSNQIHFTVYSEIDKLAMDFDPDKLEIIVSNLLSNARKFTSKNGKVILHLKTEQTGADENFVIKVKDTGAGIPAQEIPRIFDRFYQVDGSHVNVDEGTGIGLALTKELVHSMDGWIDVDSTVGKGSTFVVYLPVRREAGTTNVVPIPRIDEQWVKGDPAAPEMALNLDTDAPLVLVIDDNADILEYLKICLHERYNTLFANNGTSGLEIAFDQIPDIIICDVMMPGMNGYDVCSALKNDKRTDHIPIIMLTAKVTKRDKLAGLSEGVDAYLTKPFQKAELLMRLDQLITLRQRLIQKFQQDGYGSVMKMPSKDSGTRFVQAAVSAILKEIENPDFRAVHLARVLHLSESHLYRKLKTLTGKSTAIFIRSVRLASARKIILHTNKTISEIAYETGFSDPAWFSKAFKQEFGHSPSETRR